jgi:hypothetical protein
MNVATKSGTKPGGAASGCRGGTCQADAEGIEESPFWSLSKPPEDNYLILFTSSFLKNSF